ncbi:MAG: cation:proton antiporter [Candidatus Woesearchaeota archaeon]
MSNIFVEVSLIIFLTIIVSFIMKALKQPLLIGYIFSGILAGPYLFNLVTSVDAIEAFAEIGIAILLFLVGIHLNPKIIREVGKISLITGLGQVIFTSIIGFVIVYLVGFSLIESLYIAIALTFSSTIIIMKLLSDKKELDTLHGKISMGFLIVQDLVAMILLMVIAAMGTSSGAFELASTLVIGIFLIIIFLLIGYFILPKITSYIAKSSEFLLIFSIGWCLAAASLFYFFNFSIEVGALLAGITLSMSPYRYQIGSVLKPLRDFFILMFFIYLGSQMVFDGIYGSIATIVLLSLFVLVGNVIIVLLLMTRLGYTSRTAFLSGLTVAQISEFSLILVALGVSSGHLSLEILSFVTIISIITISGSTYMILYSKQIYNYFSPYMKKFEKIRTKEENSFGSEKFDTLVFGCHRLGNEIVQKMDKEKLLVIDFDPQIVEILQNKGVNAVYGDASDIEVLNDLNLLSLKTLISTIPDNDVNLFLLNYIKLRNPGVSVILLSSNYKEALNLYELGADYVIMPYHLGSHHLTSVALKKLKTHKTKHIMDLKAKLENQEIYRK